MAAGRRHRHTDISPLSVPLQSECPPHCAFWMKVNEWRASLRPFRRWHGFATYGVGGTRCIVSGTRMIAKVPHRRRMEVSLSNIGALLSTCGWARHYCGRRGLTEDDPRFLDSDPHPDIANETGLGATWWRCPLDSRGQPGVPSVSQEANAAYYDGMEPDLCQCSTVPFSGITIWL